MPYVLLVTKILLVFVSVVFFISGLDDFFVDMFHIVRSVYRRFVVMRRYRPLTEKQLLEQAEKPIAVMVPAWDESSVIRRMLDNNLRTVNYSRYHLFVGTYPNDPMTQREVELVRERYDNVHRIVCPKDGPTNKADCLNWIYQGVRNFEQEQGIEFDIFVLADSEDVLHPLSLKFFNYLMPRKDMIQLPVFPLDMKWHYFTAGHYADEFAENHSKDLLVRERLTGNLPSAGVGCAFSRRAMTMVAKDQNNQIFNIDSLTEDYEFGVRLGRYGLKQIFARQAIYREVTKKSFWTGRIGQKKVREYIATREYFPTRFRQAVRQKSRWMLGINLQAWASLGWTRDWWTDYTLARDRKALISQLAILMGYLVLAVVLLAWALQRFYPGSYRYPPLIEQGTWLWYLVLVDTGFLFFRFVQRAFWVQRIYGWVQALLSAPRLVWGNVINIAATFRALRQWLNYRVTGKLIQWDKTDHAYPSEDVLRSYRRKLGDLLLERRFITVTQLETALEMQRKHHRPLGAILLEQGWVAEDNLVRILGVQFHLTTRHIDPGQVRPEVVNLVTPEIAESYGVFPLEINTDGRLVLATESAIGADRLTELEKKLGRPLEICLSSRSDLASAIESAYALQTVK